VAQEDDGQVDDEETHDHLAWAETHVHCESGEIRNPRHRDEVKSHEADIVRKKQRAVLVLQ
jgi:hypothetical protein